MDKEKLKIIIVIDETSFYHPDLIQTILMELNPEVIGVARVTKIKSNFPKRIRLNHLNFLIKEFFSYFTRLSRYLSSYILPWQQAKRYYVKTVLKQFKQDYLDIEYNINKPEYINWFRAKSPDIIICFSTLYFGKEILSIPKLGCINRHSSLLPSYAGLLPMFYYVLHQENFAGTTIHFMTKKIDEGRIICQIRYPFNKNSSLDVLYSENFKYGAIATLEAIEKIRNGELATVINNYKKSYFSFPGPEQIKEFRKLKGRFI
jgi:methionyl-tRNA formyltransferase